jgi:hypothetical protein
VALPTGGGTEQPLATEVAADKEKHFAYRSIDRAALAKVAQWSRGSYDSALFEPGRLGFVPQVGARFTVGKATILPALKVENLIDVTGDASQRYVGELVAGVRGAYRVIDVVEPGLGLWTNITYTKTEEHNVDVGVVSPFVRFPLGHVTPEVGAIVPVFGQLADNKAFGIRAAINGTF